MIFSNEDKARHQAFKKMFLDGKFEVKGDAILTMASLLIWYDGLLTRAVPPPPPVVKEPPLKTTDVPSDN